MQKRIAFLASIIKVDAEAANYFQQQDSQLFWEDSWFQCQFTPFFCVGKKSTHKETSSFSKLLVLLFSTVLLALLYHFLCLLLRTVNVCVQTLPCLFCTFSPQFNHKKVVKISVSFWVNFPLEVSRERAVMAFLVGQPLCQVEVRASSSHLKSRLEKIFLDPTRLLPSF